MRGSSGPAARSAPWRGAIGGRAVRRGESGSGVVPWAASGRARPGEPRAAACGRDRRSEAGTGSAGRPEDDGGEAARPGDIPRFEPFGPDGVLRFESDDPTASGASPVAHDAALAVVPATGEPSTETTSLDAEQAEVLGNPAEGRTARVEHLPPFGEIEAGACGCARSGSIRPACCATPRERPRAAASADGPAPDARAPWGTSVLLADRGGCDG